VTHPMNKFEFDASTLPDPELNPLLNPILGAHMGRWAEVYFTNPPEKRGQAISELLRELKHTSPSESASIQVIDDERVAEKTETAAEPDSFPTAPEPLRTCSVCAHNNSAEQRFCGMCGAPLETSAWSYPPEIAEALQIPTAQWSEPEPSLGNNPRALGNNPLEHAIEPAVSSTAVGAGRDALGPAWALPERSLPHFSMESEPVSHRYRPYAGVALAILLALLVYMGWRGARAISGSAGTPPAPARAIPPAQPVPAASALPLPAASAQPSTTATTSSDENPPKSPVRSTNQEAATSRKNRPASAQPATLIVPMPARSSAVAVDESGAEDLATAETYLNGTRGVPRHSGEAADWLWKAVGKGNLAATLALSDLYLRGDGVPKSCDQARLLLDAAARKGGRAAADRLRNLRAFGCE
jgi:hypothetical protein